MKLFSLLSFAAVIFFSSLSLANTLSEIRTYGSSQIKNPNADMWDKKNDAVADAKKQATYKLARKVLKPEVYEQSTERIEKEILPYSGRYLISSTIESHSAAEDGNYRSYNAYVLFKYSLENFKSLLQSRGFAVSELQRHRVAAFIEVLDVTTVKSYSWWTEATPKLHPVVGPLQAKLKASLNEQGYDLIPIQFVDGNKGFKYMASSMGAQYYVDGSVKIEKQGESYKVSGGLFNFHEALSQKLVSSVDLKKFGKAQSSRAPASRAKAKDLLGEAFGDAAKKMNASENADHLDQGVAQIDFIGVRSPVQLKKIKNAILMNLKSEVSTLTERRIENGQVTFQARTTLSPRKLLVLMNAKLSGLGTSRGVLKEDGKTLSFRSIN